MCGIAGIYHFDPTRSVRDDEIRRMTECLHHRGPDDEGFHRDGSLALGHKRLSIIDLSDAGRQPMTNEDGRYWIVFNGEIYNYAELRQRLVAAGHRFRSHTDTEVILHQFEEEGPGCLARLNGMFAFALWDASERTLFAARDRFGVKPFYYAVRDGTFVFGSEIKALLVTSYVRSELNVEALADYVTFQFCLGDKTLFSDVSKLEPGCWLRVDGTGRISTHQYWDIDFTVNTSRSDAEHVQKLTQLLTDAVRLELRADVPLGTHLSGGLDSTAVTAFAASLTDSPIHTFSGGFLESGYDETPYARIAADAAGSIHHEVFATADEFVDLLPTLIYHMDEPAAGPGLFPQYCVARLASRHVKVVLGGQGGDEIFGGYTRYLIAYLEASLRGGILGTHEDEKYVVTFESILPNLTQLRGYEPLLKRFWRHGLFEEADRRYFDLIDRSEATRRLIRADVWRAADGYSPFDEFRAIFNDPNCHALINKMSRFDIKTLLPALLQVEDRTSMAVSLESRVPLLDHRIVELVASMPPKIKFKGGRSKHIFRRVLDGVVPDAIAARTDKMGFPVPLAIWASGGRVRELIGDTLLGPRTRQRGLFDVNGLESLIADEADYGRGAWGMLSLELWLRTFIDRPAAVPL
jgi:asparagine synthase (glutamine-hydrolysing)